MCSLGQLVLIAELLLVGFFSLPALFWTWPSGSLCVVLSFLLTSLVWFCPPAFSCCLVTPGVCVLSAFLLSPLARCRRWLLPAVCSRLFVQSEFCPDGFVQLCPAFSQLIKLKFEVLHSGPILPATQLIMTTLWRDDAGRQSHHSKHFKSSLDWMQSLSARLMKVCNHCQHVVINLSQSATYQRCVSLQIHFTQLFANWLHSHFIPMPLSFCS